VCDIPTVGIVLWSRVKCLFYGAKTIEKHYGEKRQLLNTHMERECMYVCMFVCMYVYVVYKMFITKTAKESRCGHVWEVNSKSTIR
jgi:hypothetical protein